MAYSVYYLAMVLTPTQLKSLCAEYHLSPSKQYGQNYLITDTPIQKMIKAADLSLDDTVVEIGPGFGILTFSVAPFVHRIIAFEIEKKLESYWVNQQTEHPNIEVVWGNFLQQRELLEQLPPRYKVVANIPYQITSDLIRTLLELPHKPQKIVLMIQKEVAERICASVGEMSLLAVAVQYYGVPRIVIQVNRGSFWPVPGVDSAVLEINVHNPSVQKTDKFAQQFFSIVKAGFAHKRKQLWNNLANGLHLEADMVKTVLRDVVKNEKVRAEDVSMEEWYGIVDCLASSLDK